MASESVSYWPLTSVSPPVERALRNVEVVGEIGQRQELGEIIHQLSVCQHARYYGHVTRRTRESNQKSFASQLVIRTQSGRRHGYLLIDLEELPGWRATLRLDDLDGTPMVTEIRLTAESIETWIDPKHSSHSLGFQSSGVPPDKGLTATMLRKVPVERLVRRGLSLIPSELLNLRWNDWLSADRARVGRAGRGDLFYAEWAAAYLRLVKSEEKTPAVRLAADECLSVSQVRTILGEARRRGLLTPAPRGRAGGSLTDLGKSILSESLKTKEN